MTGVVPTILKYIILCELGLIIDAMEQVAVILAGSGWRGATSQRASTRSTPAI